MKIHQMFLLQTFKGKEQIYRDYITDLKIVLTKIIMFGGGWTVSVCS